MIWIQYMAYGLFWFGLNLLDTQPILYLYLLTKFENYNETEFAKFLTFQSAASVIGLFILIPVMSKYFKFTDITIQMVVCITEALCYFFVPLAKTEWQFWLIQAIGKHY